jgi:hypothetical protein
MDFLGISFEYLDTSRCYHTRDNMDFLGISFGYLNTSRW